MSLTLLSCSEEEFDCCLINLALEQPPLRYCKSHINIVPLYPGQNYNPPNHVWVPVSTCTCRHARAESSSQTQPTGTHAALAHSCHPPYIFSPHIETLECYPWSPRTSGRHRAGQACEGHVHLSIVLSPFPSQSTREKKVCFLLCLWVFLSLCLRIGFLWCKGYHSCISPFVVAYVCGEGKWGVMVFFMECPPRPCRLPLPGLFLSLL